MVIPPVVDEDIGDIVRINTEAVAHLNSQAPLTIQFRCKPPPTLGLAGELHGQRRFHPSRRIGTLGLGCLTSKFSGRSRCSQHAAGPNYPNGRGRAP
jgi:hypothetical protein